MKKRFILLTVTFILVTAATIAITYAYFTAQRTTSDNTFTVGTLSIDLTQNNMASISPVIGNWLPGDETEVKFEVKNTSNVPVNLATYTVGSWGDPALSDTIVKVTELDYWDGSDWKKIKSNATSGLSGVVYFSPTGSTTNIYDVAAGESVNFQLKIIFDKTAGDEYQGKTYTASVNVAARQLEGDFPDGF